MFDVRKAYGYDKSKANEGINHVFGPDPKNDWVTICKIPNDNYSKALQKAFRAVHEKLTMLKSQGEEEAAAELDTKIHNEVLAETIVTNWGKGISEGKSTVKPTMADRVAVLTKYPDFKSACLEIAGDRSNYPMEEDPEVVGK